MHRCTVYTCTCTCTCGEATQYTAHSVSEVGQSSMPHLLQLVKDGVGGVQEGVVGQEEALVEAVVH